MPSFDDRPLKSIQDWHKGNSGRFFQNVNHAQFATDLQAARDQIKKLSEQVELARKGLQSIQDLGGHPEDPGVRAGRAIGIAGQMLERLKD